MSLVLSEGINPAIDRVILDRAEYERLCSINAELLKALQCLAHPMADDDDLEFALAAIKRVKA